MSMDNRQEIINVLSMKEHMVFRNRRTPVGELGETRESPAGGATKRVCPKQGFKIKSGGLLLLQHGCHGSTQAAGVEE